MEGTWPLNFLWAFGPIASTSTFSLRFPWDGKPIAFALHLLVFAFISVQPCHRGLALHPGAWAFVLNLISFASFEGHIFFCDHPKQQASLDWLLTGFASARIFAVSSHRGILILCCPEGIVVLVRIDWPHWLRATGDVGQLWGEELWSVVHCPRLGWLTYNMAYV